MGKETFYFPHDYNPTSDPKMQALLAEFGGLGYGVYWRIVEMLHEEEHHRIPLKGYVLTAIAKQMLTNAEQVQAIINYCISECFLFDSDSEFLWSNRVNRNFEKRAELSEKRSVAGRLGAIAKQTSANTSKGKESKVKEKKEINIPFLLFWNAYNKKEGRVAAEEKWNKLSDSDRDTIMKTLPGFLSKIKDKKYVPHPTTYLNQKRWLDDQLVLTPSPAIIDNSLYVPDPNWRYK